MNNNVPRTPAGVPSADVQRFEQHLKLLPAALVALYQCMTVEEVLDTTCRYAKEMVNADLAFVVLQEDKITRFSSDASHKSNKRLLEKLAGWSARVCETINIRNTSKHDRYVLPAFFSPFCRSLIVIPCQKSSKVVLLTSWESEFLADRHDIAILESITGATLSHIERLAAISALQESEVRFRTLVEDTAQATWEADPDGTINYLSASWEAYVGQTEEDWSRNGWQGAVHPDDLAYVKEQWRNAVASYRPVNVEFRLRNAQGKWCWTHARAAPIFNPDGTVRKWVGMNIDITDAKDAEARLRESEEFNRVSAEAGHIGTWYIDLQANELVLSPKKAELLGLPKDTPQIAVEQWMSWLCPDDVPKVMLAIQDVLSNRTAIDVEYRINLPGQAERWLYSRGTVIVDGNRPVRRLYGATLDITERKQAVETIWRQANFDSLTSLPNRRLFHDRLEHDIKSAYRNHHKLALLFLDLDRFKQVNDLLGHDIGDKLLVHVAERLRGCARGSDTVARLSGDEFTVILTDLPERGHIELVTQKILNKLSQPFHLDDDVAHISVSIGAALYPDDGKEPSELMRKADQAMYAAKANGRNGFSYFTKSMDEEAHLHVMLLNELRQALANAQLQVLYQPVVTLDDSRIVKAEALLRWQHPRLGRIDPIVFIPLAEESGVINDIGTWVFQQAAMTAKRCSDQLGGTFQISVNTSPAQFRQQEGMGGWIRYLNEIGLSGDSITIEITEGLLMNSSAVITDELLRYRAAGIKVAIDDFGTGYSSMAYLKKFHVDFLKIDQSFVRDIASDHTQRTIAESIIVMAHKLGLKVIAEGVETEAQRAILEEAGCDYGQGFLFCKPVPSSEFELMLHH
jgi:diguanylate cyclase (GGDEF)-like protein/PAS domain S-box-containing protein